MAIYNTRDRSIPPPFASFPGFWFEREGEWQWWERAKETSKTFKVYNESGYFREERSTVLWTTLPKLMEPRLRVGRRKPAKQPEPAPPGWGDW